MGWVLLATGMPMSVEEAGVRYQIKCVPQSSVAVRMQAVTLLSHAMSADPTLGANVSVTVTLSAGAQTMSSVPKQCRASSEIGGWWPKQWDASSTEGTGSAAQTRDNVLKEANHFCRLFNKYSVF